MTEHGSDSISGFCHLLSTQNGLWSTRFPWRVRQASNSLSPARGRSAPSPLRRRSDRCRVGMSAEQSPDQRAGHEGQPVIERLD